VYPPSSDTKAEQQKFELLPIPPACTRLLNAITGAKESKSNFFMIQIFIPLINK
jgi:hypothetical protein